jgi:surface protein
MEFDMSTDLNFPIKYKYARVSPGDYVVGNATNANYMYAGSLNKVIKVLSNISNVTSMVRMFDECSFLISIHQLDTSNVNNMRYMFNYCFSLTTIPQLNTSKVTNMSNMFYNCGALTTIPQLDTGNVTNMDSMFNSCNRLVSIPLLNCQNLTSISSFFGYSTMTALTDLGGFKDLGKQSSVSGISYGFLDNASNLTHESLMNVINNLYDRKSNGMSNLSIKFGTTNLAKLTDEEKAIAINKGWNLS